MRVCYTIVLILFVAVLPLTSTAATIRVPDDYSAIVPAVIAAASGDTILVAGGHYVGALNRNIDPNGKLLKIIAIDGPQVTSISCAEDGRAFYLGSGEPPGTLVEGFTIEGGMSERGGCIRVEYGASLTIRNCVIRNGWAEYGGGGVSFYEANEAVLDGVEFRDNTATYGGGAIFVRCTSADITGCTFVNNLGEKTGGLRIESTPTALSSSIFRGNSAEAYSGAMVVFNEHADVANCLFYGNHSQQGGAVSSRESGSIVLSNCTLALNAASNGGAIECNDSAGAIDVYRCIIAFQTDGSALWCAAGSDVSTWESCIFGNYERTDLCGESWDCLSEDPWFCGMWSSDFSLSHGSPCLPAGNPWGAAIGAFGEGCGATSVEESSWGAIKAMYR